MFQDDMYKELQDAQFQNVLTLLAMNILAVAVTLGCAILLFRTAAGMRKSRFLKHLAFSVVLNVVFRLGKVVTLLVKALIAHLNGTNNPIDGVHAEALLALNSTWHGIDIIISLLSTLFLFQAWDLLRNYPKEAVHRSLFSILMTFFGSGSMLTITISLLILVKKINEYYWTFLNALDVVSAAIVLWLVGWQLQKTLRPSVKTSYHVLREILLWLTTGAYLIWGGLQPPYYWLQDFSWYSISLLIAGLIATILTLILCSLALEEKPEYSSEPPAS